MPFLTETIWQLAKGQEFFKEKALIIAAWPESKKE